MVDELRSTSASGAKGYLHIKKENKYHFQGHMCEIGLMEHMLQCALAKVKHMRGLKGAPEATPLVNEITRFSLNFLPKTDETIESSVRLVNFKDGKANATAIVYVEGQIAAICRIRITLREQ